MALDYSTKYVVFNQETSMFVNVMIKAFISRFGVLLELYSDQGYNFEIKFFCNPYKNYSIASLI